jgi:cupin fold WbuC family metalloprotein
MNLVKISNEVFYANETIVKIGSDEINFLKTKSKLSPRKRVRICTHANPEVIIHEMFIGIHAGSYIRPHKHQNKIESFHIISGEVAVVLFDDVGNIVSVSERGAIGGEKSFYFKMKNNLFHTLFLRSDFLLLHEVTSGPFIVGESLLAAFSPPENDELECRKYLLYLEQKIKQYYSNPQRI